MYPQTHTSHTTGNATRATGTSCFWGPNSSYVPSADPSRGKGPAALTDIRGSGCKLSSLAEGRQGSRGSILSLLGVGVCQGVMTAESEAALSRRRWPTVGEAEAGHENVPREGPVRAPRAEPTPST